MIALKNASMSTLRITDGMFLSLKRQCDDAFIASVTDRVEIVTSTNNLWDISDYFETDFSDANNEDKANFVICFLEKGGRVNYDGFEITRDSIPNFLVYLSSNGYITSDEEANISLKWTDYTNGEPYLSLL